GHPRSRGPDAGGSDGRRWTAVLRSSYVLLAFLVGFALGLYLILDFALSVSLYLRFVAVYCAFWVLVLLLLLKGSPARQKLLILALLAIAFSSVRFIDWNSRKPFLKDLYRIEVGMTVAQVEQIMGDYMTGGGVPLGSPGTRLDGRLAEGLIGPAEPATGTISYRHTDEWWGNSDWGVVTLENGRVVDIWFSHD
ncbi:MAG: hypothetical protein JSV36_12985, partial [Anaerolineae bacterium]